MECQWCGIGSAKFKVKRWYYPFGFGIFGFSLTKKYTKYICESCIVSISKAYINSNHKIDVDIIKFK